MRSMTRNKRLFYYANYEGMVPVVDENGYKTGEYATAYTNPILSAGNVSPATGTTATQLFGEVEGYDKIITRSESLLSASELSRLWVDRSPKLTEDGALVLDEEGYPETPHDYVVHKIANSLNGVAYAIRKVTVDGQ